MNRRIEAGVGPATSRSEGNLRAGRDTEPGSDVRTVGLGLSAVVPCYEEVATLPGLLARLEAALAAAPLASFEILLVVSAAARDGTPALAAALAAGVPHRRVVVQPADDPGYGRAIGRGLAAANHAWVLVLDGDGQLDPADLPHLLALTTHADLVLGFRHNRMDLFFRRASGWLYTRAACLLLGLPPLRDLDCGLKLVHRARLGALTLTRRTGAVNAELVLAAVRAGARIVEVPVRHAPRPAGVARFERRLGPLRGLPAPREALALLSEVLGLAWGRHG